MAEKLEHSQEGNTMSTEKVMTMLRSRGLEGIAESCLRFRSYPIQEEDLRLGSSKLGGSPDLPTGIPWPTWNGRPLDFLLQLDLTEIPRNVADVLLPERGWLYFFYDIESNTWGFDVSHRGSWRVVFFAGDRETLCSRKRPDNAIANLRSCKLAFFEGIHLDCSAIEDEKLESDLDRLCHDENLQNAMTHLSGHQILGKTEGVQHSYESMQLQCQFVSNGIYMGGGGGPVFDEFKAKQLESGISDWRLLLELGSDDNAGLDWTEWGRLYFWIREEDLLHSHFHNVWALFQCL
jgi:uncharacterized protein YwqG